MTVTGMVSQSPARTVHVEHCMGTVFTVDVRGPGDWDDAVRDVVRWLHRVDRVFSTYRPDSDVCRLRRGEVSVVDADPDVAVVLDLCAELHAQTEGWFSALTPEGIDPTGLVKGWAIERAAQMLTWHGSRNHAVSGGGDMQLVGEAAPGRPWHVGISDPSDRRRVVTSVTGRDLAVATSGTAERGDHIVDPFTGRPARGVAAATVVGPSLTRVDAMATAAFARGVESVAWIDALGDHEAFVVAADGTVRTTRGWAKLSGQAGH